MSNNYRFLPWIIAAGLIFFSSCVAESDSVNTLVEDPDPPVIPSTANDTWTPGTGYTEVWTDEFDGPGINTSIWSYETAANGTWSPTWNNEWQDYVDDGTGGKNAFIQEGVLVIRATRKKPNNLPHAWDSARLVTKGKKSFQYGKIAARIALPYGKGIWPAFWMLGTNGSTWPACGEIDIMEMIGGTTTDNVVHGTLHWSNASSAHAQNGTSTAIIDPREFHVYELEWSATQIRIAVDGNWYFTQAITAADMSEFHQAYYLLLNLAVGGNWPGYPDSSTVFPQCLFVDWIKVYEAD